MVKFFPSMRVELTKDQLLESTDIFPAHSKGFIIRLSPDGTDALVRFDNLALPVVVPISDLQPYPPVEEPLVIQADAIDLLYAKTLHDQLEAYYRQSRHLHGSHAQFKVTVEWATDVDEYCDQCRPRQTPMVRFDVGTRVKLRQVQHYGDTSIPAGIVGEVTGLSTIDRDRRLVYLGEEWGERLMSVNALCYPSDKF